MRIKSKDIYLKWSIFYLAFKLIFDSFKCTKVLLNYILYLHALKIKMSLQVSHRQAHDDVVKFRFSDVNQLSTS